MRILSVEIDNLTFNEAILQIERFIKSKKSHHIVTVNPEYIVRAQNDKKLRTIINHADLRVPDGIGLVKLAGLKERVTGIDLIWQIAKLSEDKGYKIALLGGREEAAQQTAARLKLIHPRTTIVMVDPLGKIEPETLRVNLSLVRKLERTKPHIALVALGMGKQDLFIEQLLKKVKIPVVIGVGGAFDIISGVTPRAPYIMRKLGIEWLWRLLIEPKRIGRILTATVTFPLLFLLRRSR